MNKKDKAELNKAIGLMEDAKAIIESLKESEQEKFDNLSDGLQQSERGQSIESAANNLDNAYSELESAIDNCNDCMND